jgi:hypothetical protein
MGSKASRVAVAVTTAALAIAPMAVAGLPKDYSKNGATGDFAPQVVHKNYSLNGATGDYRPALPTTAVPAPVVRIVKEQPSFAWGDAVLGGAFTIVLVLFFGISVRRVRRRRIPAPAPARPTAA